MGVEGDIQATARDRSRGGQYTRGDDKAASAASRNAGQEGEKVSSALRVERRMAEKNNRGLQAGRGALSR